MKCVHLFYIFVQLTYKICASDPQKVCIRPTTGLHPTQRSEKLTYRRQDALFFSIECVSDMHWTNSSLKLLKTHVLVDPKYLIKGCNVCRILPKSNIFTLPFKWKIQYFLIIVRKCALNDIFADWVITKMRRNQDENCSTIL